GLPAERAMGPWRFVLLFLLGGAVANLAAVLAIGTPDRLIIGASGAVSALIGAYLALFPSAKLGVVVPLGLFLQFVKVPAPLLIGVWAALQVVFTFIGPAFGAVAWSAHLAGFAFGRAFALLARAGIARRLRRRRGLCGRAAALDRQSVPVRVIVRTGTGISTGARSRDQLLELGQGRSDVALALQHLAGVDAGQRLAIAVVGHFRPQVTRQVGLGVAGRAAVVTALLGVQDHVGHDAKRL